MADNEYFLDANVVINILNQGTGTSEVEERRAEDLKDIFPIIQDENSKIFVSSLVRLEVLRGILNESEYDIAREVLNAFSPLPDAHMKEIIEETIDFMRFYKQQGIKKKIGVIDYIHFITAKHYEFTMLSFDDDLKRLEEVYRTYDTPELTSS